MISTLLSPLGFVYPQVMDGLVGAAAASHLKLTRRVNSHVEQPVEDGLVEEVTLQFKAHSLPQILALLLGLVNGLLRNHRFILLHCLLGLLSRLLQKQTNKQKTLFDCLHEKGRNKVKVIKP